jgi:hypothetical protein
MNWDITEGVCLDVEGMPVIRDRRGRAVLDAVVNLGELGDTMSDYRVLFLLQHPPPPPQTEPSGHPNPHKVTPSCRKLRANEHTFHFLVQKWVRWQRLCREMHDLCSVHTAQRNKRHAIRRPLLHFRWVIKFSTCGSRVPHFSVLLRHVLCSCDWAWRFQGTCMTRVKFSRFLNFLVQ